MIKCYITYQDRRTLLAEYSTAMTRFIDPDDGGMMFTEFPGLKFYPIREVPVVDPKTE